MVVEGESSYSQLLKERCTHNLYDGDSEDRVWNSDNLKLAKKHFNQKSNNFHLQVSPELAAIISNFNTILVNLNKHQAEKWYFSETVGASVAYLKNILSQAKDLGLIKNYVVTRERSSITFNRMQERGNRRQHHWVSICEPYSQILTHVMVGGAISYDRVYGKRLKIKNVVRSDRGHTW